MNFFTNSNVEAFDAEWRDQVRRLGVMHGPALVADGAANRVRRHALMSSLPGRIVAENVTVPERVKTRSPYQIVAIIAICYFTFTVVAALL